MAPAAAALAMSPGPVATGDPEVPTPSDPEIPTPSDPEMPTPGDPEVPTPGDPEIPTPGDPEVPTPGDPEIPTPGDPEVPTPGDPEIPTPGDPGPAAAGAQAAAAIPDAAARPRHRPAAPVRAASPPASKAPARGPAWRRLLPRLPQRMLYPRMANSLGLGLAVGLVLMAGVLVLMLMGRVFPSGLPSLMALAMGTGVTVALVHARLVRARELPPLAGYLALVAVSGLGTWAFSALPAMVMTLPVAWSGSLFGPGDTALERLLPWPEMLRLPQLGLVPEVMLAVGVVIATLAALWTLAVERRVLRLGRRAAALSRTSVTVLGLGWLSASIAAAGNGPVLFEGRFFGSAGGHRDLRLLSDGGPAVKTCLALAVPMTGALTGRFYEVALCPDWPSSDYRRLYVLDTGTLISPTPMVPSDGFNTALATPSLEQARRDNHITMINPATNVEQEFTVTELWPQTVGRAEINYLTDPATGRLGTRSDRYVYCIVFEYFQCRFFERLPVRFGEGQESHEYSIAVAGAPFETWKRIYQDPGAAAQPVAQ